MTNSIECETIDFEDLFNSRPNSDPQELEIFPHLRPNGSAINLRRTGSSWAISWSVASSQIAAIWLESRSLSYTEMPFSANNDGVFIVAQSVLPTRSPIDQPDIYSGDAVSLGHWVFRSGETSVNLLGPKWLVCGLFDGGTESSVIDAELLRCLSSRPN